MKSARAIVVSFVLAASVLIAFNWPRNRIPIAAQEAPRSKANKDQRNDEPGLFERSSPAFYVDDVIDTLTSATEKLIDQGLIRNSDDLKEGLQQTKFSIRLPPAASKPLSPQERYRRAAESVFLVAGLTKPTDDESNWQTSFATAFAVHEDGILSTSAHVFEHDDQDDAVVVMDIRGRVFPVVEILASDSKSDTCLFRIGQKGLRPLPLGSNAVPGTPIHVIGHPGDSFFYFSAGHIANYERDEAGLLWLNVTADFGQGSSGGPVMDEEGNIVGQVSRTYTLYAGGEASNRRRRPIRVRQVSDDEATVESAEDAANAVIQELIRLDPQMVFKSCTPVSAIRQLVTD